MDDLIRRSDLAIYTSATPEQIASITAVDAVEVVRCRECKWNSNFPEIPLCRYMHYPNFDRKGDGYCSMGQRREDGDA